MAISFFGVGLLLAGVAIDRFLLSPSTPTASPFPTAPPSRFLASFEGTDTVLRHLKGVELAHITQKLGSGLRVDQGIHTKNYHYFCSTPNALGYDEFTNAMQAIGDDITAQVAAEGGTTDCKNMGWGVRPSEWVYEVGGRRGVVTILVLPLNQPGPTDLEANLAVLVQVAEF